MKKKMIKDSGFMLISGIIQKVLAFLQNIFLLNILGPAYQGIRVIIQTYLDYSNYANLGSIKTLQKESMEKKNIFGETMGLIVITSIIGLFITTILIIFYGNLETKLSLVFVYITSVIINFSSIFDVSLKAQEKYTHISIIFLIQFIIQLILSIILTYMYEYIGFFISLLISRIFVLFALIYISKTKFNPTFNLLKIYNLIKNSIPILLLTISILITVTLDRLIIYKYFGETILGLYSLGLITQSFIIYVNNTLWQPTINKLFDNQLNKDRFIKANQIVDLLISYFYLSILCLTPTFKYIFPKYQGAEIFVIILGITGIFYPFIQTYTLQKFKKETKGAFLLGMLYVISILLSLFVTLFFGNIYYTSITIMILTSTSFIIFSTFVNKNLGLSYFDTIKLHLQTLSLIFVGLVILYFTNKMQNLYYNISISFLLITLIYGSIFLYLNHKYKIFNIGN